MVQGPLDAEEALVILRSVATKDPSTPRRLSSS
jgi:hypothetical protein